MATAKHLTLIQDLDIEKRSCESRQFAEPTQKCSAWPWNFKLYGKEKQK
jgi:hypothetical protein